MRLQELLSDLEYSQSPHYITATGAHDPESAALFRAAYRAGVDGIYMFNTSPDGVLLRARPAVYVAEAASLDAAKRLHARLWNLGHAPFLIVVLPNQIRIYTGFVYSRTTPGAGLIADIPGEELSTLNYRLTSFTSEAIDSGRLWQEKGSYLKPSQRVDNMLLASLRALSAALIDRGLDKQVAHALIGKYVYIRYLRDRTILSDEWLSDNQLTLAQVLSREATITGLRQLVESLEARFNGEVFPIDFDAASAPSDEHISLVASVFRGDQLVANDLLQLSLDFQVYDFAYIPIELLSSIYEQFLEVEGRTKRVGAFYTPEPLADYLIAEMNSVKPLQRGMRVLDPSCGSGVFLVLAYRELIETEIAKRPAGKLSPEELSTLLRDFYGVEREPEACYVAEFSLLLTLLDYVDPPALHANDTFRFPRLHNTQIFACDFFDSGSAFWTQRLKFDWIIGNPPWIELKPATPGEQFVRSWIDEHRQQYPISGSRVAEAFSWHVTEVLNRHGIVGLVLPAKTLFNHEAKSYRRAFFQVHQVARVSNFANLRMVLFGGRSTAPAFTIVFRKASSKRAKPDILHYGPFVINQMARAHGRVWTITLNGGEIKTIPAQEAEKGESITWKTALWGSHVDTRAIERLQVLFPRALGDIANERGWKLNEGPQLRNSSRNENDKLKYIPWLDGQYLLDTKLMTRSGHRYFIPSTHVLTPIPEEMWYVRVRGGEAGFEVSAAPHIVLSASWRYAIFSKESFVIPPRQIGLSGPPDDELYLRALSAYLSSSVVTYYLFFRTPAWGIERDTITLDDVRSIPVPRLTQRQLRQLADLQQRVALMDAEGEEVQSLKADIDQSISRILDIPEDIVVLATEFVRQRLTLISQNGDSGGAVDRPSDQVLSDYAKELVADLDDFASITGVRHAITIGRAQVPSLQEVVVCSVEIVEQENPIPVRVSSNTLDVALPLASLYQSFRERFSQWTYVQRELRIFDGPRIHICKAPRLIDWSRSQAMNDAEDIIAEVLSTKDSAWL